MCRPGQVIDYLDTPVPGGFQPGGPLAEEIPALASGEVQVIDVVDQRLCSSVRKVKLLIDLIVLRDVSCIFNVHVFLTTIDLIGH